MCVLKLYNPGETALIASSSFHILPTIQYRCVSNLGPQQCRRNSAHDHTQHQMVGMMSADETDTPLPPFLHLSDGLWCSPNY